MKSQSYIDLAFETLTGCYNLIESDSAGEYRKNLQNYIEEYIEYAGEYSMVKSLDYEDLASPKERCLFWHVLLISLSSIYFATREVEVNTNKDDDKSEDEKVKFDKTVYFAKEAGNLIKSLNNFAKTEKNPNFIKKGIFSNITYDIELKIKIILCCAYFYRNETYTLGIEGLDGINLDSHLSYLIYLDPKLSSKYNYRDAWGASKEILCSEKQDDVECFLNRFIDSLEFYAFSSDGESFVVYQHLQYIHDLLVSITPLEKITSRIQSITFDRKTGDLTINGKKLDNIKNGSKQQSFLKVFFDKEYSFDKCAQFFDEFDLSNEKKLSDHEVGRLNNLMKQVSKKIESCFEIQRLTIFQPKKDKTFSLMLRPELRKFLELHE